MRRSHGLPAVAAAALLGLVTTGCGDKESDTGAETTDTEDTSYSTAALYGSPNTGYYDDMDEDGWSAADGDCDDSDASIHPEAKEIPGDGIDSNCNNDDDT